jgi:hypothetical protein
VAVAVNDLSMLAATRPDAIRVSTQSETFGVVIALAGYT